MFSFFRVINFCLILAVTSYIMFFPVANANSVAETGNIHHIPEIESRGEHKFFEKFDRKFDRFALDVNETVNEYSDYELNQMYEDMIVWLEQHGNYAMSRAMIAQHDKGSGSVRRILLQMVSENARKEAKAYLKTAIEEAGGFEAFQKLTKTEKRKKIDVKCRVKKIASFMLIAPLTGLGMLTGMSAVGAIFAGVFTPVVVAWIGTTVVTDVFAFPWFLDHMVVGCYNEYKHPGFSNTNP